MVVLLLLVVRVLILVQMDHLLDVSPLRHDKDMTMGVDHIDFRSIKP